MMFYSLLSCKCYNRIRLAVSSERYTFRLFAKKFVSWEIKERRGYNDKPDQHVEVHPNQLQDKIYLGYFFGMFLNIFLTDYLALSSQQFLSARTIVEAS